MTRMPKETIAPETEEMGHLTAAEIDCVSGAAGLALAGAGIRLSVADSKKVALAQQLEKSYADTHPYEYYGPFG